MFKNKIFRILLILVSVYVVVFYYKVLPELWGNPLRVTKNNSVLDNDIPYDVIDAYYQSNYGSCQHSVVRENKINCKKLIKNETMMTQIIPVNESRICNLTKITENCQLFRHINGYDDKVITKLEEDFPLAFGIRLHNSPEQIEQILRIIYRPHNFYCIHVDTGSDIHIFNSLKAVARCFENVVVLSKIRTLYSSIRLVEADLLCMKEALKSSIQWKYFLNMAGEEVPLKTNLEIVQICQLLQGRNDIESEPATPFAIARIKWEFNVTEFQIIKTNVLKKPFTGNFLLRKGCAYGTFARKFVQFVFKNDKANDLFEFLKDTYAPEEAFFNTLNTVDGAPGGYNITIKHFNRDFLSRTVLWSWGEPINCPGEFRRAVCVFNNKALPWLVKQPEMIVNKMDGNYDQVVIDCMEEYLRNRTLQADVTGFNKTRYLQYPHIKDLRNKNLWEKI
ncbi:beta-1,3-galactosyl-O-glycosyl-glycoprotein beta-1,6-N-acetylglucosaminyltransferase 3-like [Patella vulgata]|uniref:beta-1,3-galactosyl-O-glycosyl-glycoprotein beta-1,6-N-acetylglucosaminyltransferase 3-like n=1 Tax=Patella vulgata TaxID=6465 RepID=UPI0024A89B52|nr:beta-1,3-galactosyl-O-glycosyl-glycoprotein beta-1,6-N-acetylglucosaminyltransferase 3-like [Patella vulgata]XP_055957723.1 beta-1,3-galactosyl-O-glycosyl-glycoprotein beta-1,6-N-acetylglucosaminyltransferase 3-like [Patella vulgata]